MIDGISRKKDIDTIFSKGKVKQFSFGRAYILQKESAGDFAATGVRLVILIRKKLGKAVKRNRAKRIIKEALRTLVKSKELKKPLDMAIVLNTVEVRFSDVLEEMKDGLKSYFEKR